MTDNELLQRVVADSQIMVGKPTIKGTRLTVDFILDLMAHGATVEEITAEYSGLTPDDVRACLLFASQSVAQASFLPFSTAAERT